MIPLKPTSEDKEDVVVVSENVLNSDCFILLDKNSKIKVHFKIIFYNNKMLVYLGNLNSFLTIGECENTCREGRGSRTMCLLPRSPGKRRLGDLGNNLRDSLFNLLLLVMIIDLRLLIIHQISIINIFRENINNDDVGSLY